MSRDQDAGTESIMLDLLDRWEVARERGQPLTPEELCAEHPELLDQMHWKIEALKKINNHLETQSLGPPRHNGGLHLDQPVQAGSNYSTFQFLAAGGLGMVFSATDQTLNREVAVKFIQPRLLPDPISRRQFDLEAQITGRLEHPGVVPLYGIGHTAEGKPFYVMRYIRGDTLDSRIERLHGGATPGVDQFAGVEFRDLLHHFVTVCNTIAYAHNRGILHRDIKPANVMLGRYGETLVVDWGLAMPITRDERAKASGEHTLLSTADSDTGTSSGGGAGTLAYMSPEQSAGDVALTPASDIYSLGATLYKLLTGRAPFVGKHARNVVEAVRRGEFPPPRELNRAVPVALQAICLRAMAFDPAERYATALDLADDVQRFLADEPVSVWRDSKLQRLGRWCRRHRTAALALTVLTLAMLIVAGIAAVGFQRMARYEHQLLLASQATEGRSLQMAARFAARTVAGEIDIRWRILEAQAADAELRSLLAEDVTIQEDPQRQRRIQAWLDARFLEYNTAVGYTSWFVCDRHGYQIARSPRAATIGENFAFRDYFHGELGTVPADPEPIRRVYLSQVFESAAVKEDMIAFSVPIWDGNADALDRRVVGVLAMTVLVGEFRILESGLYHDQVAMLVDTRDDLIDGSPRAGRILHHPRLGSPDPDSPVVRRLAPELVDELRDGRRRELARRESSSLDEVHQPTPLLAMPDPLAASTAPVQTAFEPVVVRGRDASLEDTGWIVIVQSPTGQ